MKLKFKMITLVVVILLVISGTVFAGTPWLDDIFGRYQYAIEGDDTPQYNCLAYVLGVTDRPIWPWGYGNVPIEDVDEYLHLKGGYVRTYVNSDVNKIAAYYQRKNPDGTQSYLINHFAKITENGTTWTSGTIWAEMGDLELISTQSHDSHQDVGEHEYGDLACKYK